MELTGLPFAAERWRATVRIVPSRFPPVGLFERVADPRDLDAVYDLEGLTNPRLREESGELARVAPEDRIGGPGSTPVMAAFTHINPYGSRFSDGSYGVYYCARARPTAIRETVYHRERFLRDSAEAPIMLEMRVYYADLRERLHDIRVLRERHPEWYHPDDYRAARELGRALRDAQSFGVLYASVRDAGGECAAVLRPRALSAVTQGEHLGYYWDGERIAQVAQLLPVADLSGG